MPSTPVNRRALSGTATPTSIPRLKRLKYTTEDTEDNEDDETPIKVKRKGRRGNNNGPTTDDGEVSADPAYPAAKRPKASVPDEEKALKLRTEKAKAKRANLEGVRCIK